MRRTRAGAPPERMRGLASCARRGASAGAGPSTPSAANPPERPTGWAPLPPHRLCNGKSALKVGCSAFNSSYLLPAAAYTSDVDLAPEPIMNFKTFSGTVNTADRTIESLRAHYFVQRTVPTTRSLRSGRP